MTTPFTFSIREINSSLFGVVEAEPPSDWRKQFSTHQALTSVKLDQAAFDLIASDMGKDGYGIMHAAQRYVSGQYPLNVLGLESELGDLGEFLTFLVYKARNVTIERVAGIVPGKKMEEGDRFPKPDFILENNGQLEALEVKSTQAFDFLKLDTTKTWTWLQPCSAVKACREEALPQLGYIDLPPSKLQHKLKTHHERIVAFPVQKGIAAAVLAVDGRVDTLRQDKRFRTPNFCRPANNCWTCLPSKHHFVMVHMPNTPDRLALGGSAGDKSSAWLNAYARWTRALHARDRIAARPVLDELASAVGDWLDGSTNPNADAMRTFWRHYLHSAMHSRGIDLPVPPIGKTAPAQVGGAPFTPRLEPPVLELQLEEFGRFATDRKQPRGAASAICRFDDQFAGTITARHTGGLVNLEFFSATWHAGSAIESDEDASDLAMQALFFLARSQDAQLDSAEWEDIADGNYPLRRVTATVGDAEVFLGWASYATPIPFWAPLERALWREFFRIEQIRSRSTASGRPPFVTVRSDGRVLLRMVKR